MEDFFYLKCSKCGAENRVSREKLHLQPLCSKCQALLPVPAQSPVVITDSTFEEEVLRSLFPVLVDFWASWCGPCRIVAPIVTQLAEELKDKVKVGKLNVDENPITPSRYQIMSIPTLLLFKEGKVVERIVGAVSKNEIVKSLETWIGKLKEG